MGPSNRVGTALEMGGEDLGNRRERERSHFLFSFYGTTSGSFSFLSDSLHSPTFMQAAAKGKNGWPQLPLCDSTWANTPDPSAALLASGLVSYSRGAKERIQSKQELSPYQLLSVLWFLFFLHPAKHVPDPLGESLSSPVLSPWSPQKSSSCITLPSLPCPQY